MINTLILLVIGVLIGWNIPQPAIVKLTVGKLIDLVKSLIGKLVANFKK